MMGKREREKRILEAISGDLVDFLVSKRVSPTSISLSSLFLALISSIAYYLAASNPSLYYLAAVFFLASGFLDAVDGAVARRLGVESNRGAFLDSVLDKLGECTVLAAIIGSGAVSSLWGSGALASSIMVSYVRARGESLGIDLKGVGFMERAERIILISVAALIEPMLPGALDISMIVLMILSIFTAAQRIIHVLRRLQS